MAGPVRHNPAGQRLSGLLRIRVRTRPPWGDLAFTLNSAHGDDIWLSAVDGADNFLGYRAGLSFGASQNGVSFGPFATSQGVDFVPLASLTFGVDTPASVEEFRLGLGELNAYPKVGPVIISEIQYHPVSFAGGLAVENAEEEFIEFRRT